MESFDSQIGRLDVGLFHWILSQSTENDRRALLAIQLALRERLPSYAYLEIGSYKGGSLQPFLLDPRCAQIHSIDLRPREARDVRGGQNYSENTTACMLRLLASIPGAQLHKVKTYEAATGDIPIATVSPKPNLCFVDGEHTDEAVLGDSRFCLDVLAENGCIVYHDANLVYRGLNMFLEELSSGHRKFRAFHLSDSIFFLEFDELRVSERPYLKALLNENYKGYLWSLAASDDYRRFYFHPCARLLRAVLFRAGLWRPQIAGSPGLVSAAQPKPEGCI